MRRITKRASVGTALAVAGTVAGAALAQPAQAASGDYSYVYGGYNVRAWDALNAPVLGMTAYSQWVRTWCYEDGDWAQGTNRWFEVTAYTGAGWKTGFVIAAALPNAYQARVPHC